MRASLIAAVVLTIAACPSKQSLRRLYVQALADQRDGRPAEARTGYQRIIDVSPTFEGTRNNLAVLAVGDGKLDRALELIRQELTAGPSLAKPRINEVLVLLMAHEGGTSATDLRRKAMALTGSFPDNHMAHLLHGVVLVRTGGDPKAAAAALAKAEKASSTALRAQAAFASGVMLGRAREFAAAAARFKEATRLRRDAVAHYNRALMLAAANDHTTALTELKLSAALDDSAAAVPHLEALVLHRAGNPKEALAALARARSLDPKRIGVELLTGVIHLDLGNLTKAEAAFTAEPQLAPKSADVVFNLGMVALERDQLEAAAAAFESAAALDPKDAEAAHNAEVLNKLLGK